MNLSEKTSISARIGVSRIAYQSAYTSSDTATETRYREYSRLGISALFTLGPSNADILVDPSNASSHPTATTFNKLRSLLNVVDI